MGLVPRENLETLLGPIPEERLSLLERYVRVLKASSRRFGLVSRRDEERLGEHLIDSASILALDGIDARLAAGELADLGTGGGLPGVVLAILRPGINVALVDSRRSRIVFLKQLVQDLELANVRIVHERIEHIPEEERFANATARALGRIEDVLAPSLGVIRPGGRLFLYKGPAWVDERERAIGVARRSGAVLEEEVAVALPDLDRATTFVVFHVKQ